MDVSDPSPSRAPAPPDDPPRDGAHNRLTAWILAGALLVALAANVWVLTRGGDDPLTSAPSPDGGVDSVGMAAPPQAAPVRGSYTVSRPDQEGQLHVVSWIRGSSPIAALRLSFPTAGNTVGPVRVRLSYDRVRTIGSSGACTTCGTRTTTVGPSGRRVELPRPAYRIELRYTLRGVVDQHSSVPGRLLVEAAALDVRYRPRQGPARVLVKAPRVLSAACSAAPGPDANGIPSDPAPCGGPTSEGWQIDLQGARRDDSVMAQVQFPQ